VNDVTRRCALRSPDLPDRVEPTASHVRIAPYQHRPMPKPDASLTPVETPTDTEFITRILAGDMRALEQLMRLHNRKLYRTARAILGDDAEAQDAVQEAYLRAYNALHTFRGEAKLSTWLVRISANEALMRRRRRAQPAPEDSNPETLADEAADPEADAQRSEMRRLLESRIDALAEGYRTVFVLRGVEELSVEEVAAALNIPEATVRTRFFRARGLLRAAMAGDIDATAKDAFSFAGSRCDRIVAFVLAHAARAETALC
jgi:RNA polymerase sigma-70 factor (ECF subfamily)